MCSNTTDDIDALALTVEKVIAQNQEAIAEYEEEYTPYNQFQFIAGHSPMSPDSVSLFG
jgi:DNA-binding GntR family transcriptional regulator